MSINQVCEACDRVWFDAESEQVDICPACEAKAQADARRYELQDGLLTGELSEIG